MDVLSNIDPTSSGVSSVDPYRPSFFELIAQEQLSSLLKPAIRYVLTVPVSYTHLTLPTKA